jgi:hypothetical protein
MRANLKESAAPEKRKGPRTIVEGRKRKEKEISPTEQYVGPYCCTTRIVLLYLEAVKTHCTLYLLIAGTISFTSIAPNIHTLQLYNGTHIPWWEKHPTRTLPATYSRARVFSLKFTPPRSFRVVY